MSNPAVVGDKVPFPALQQIAVCLSLDVLAQTEYCKGVSITPGAPARPLGGMAPSNACGNIVVDKFSQLQGQIHEVLLDRSMNYTDGLCHRLLTGICGAHTSELLSLVAVHNFWRDPLPDCLLFSWEICIRCPWAPLAFTIAASVCLPGWTDASLSSARPSWFGFPHLCSQLQNSLIRASCLGTGTKGRAISDQYIRVPRKTSRPKANETDKIPPTILHGIRASTHSP